MSDKDAIVYGVKISDLDERIAEVVKKLAIPPKERLKKYGSLRLVGNEIFQKEDNSENAEFIAELKEKFLSLEDPTEYAFALEVFKSWGLYNRIKKDSAILRAYLAEWHSELEVRLRSKALKDIISKSEKSSEASKYLFEGKYKKQLEDYSKDKQKKKEDDEKVIFSVFESAEKELEDAANSRMSN